MRGQRFIPSSTLGRCKFCGDEVWQSSKEEHATAECVAVQEPSGRHGPQ